jgi:hypothetical protein
LGWSRFVVREVEDVAARTAKRVVAILKNQGR